VRNNGDLSMAGGLLFVSQALLDIWASQGRVDLGAHGITLLSGEGQGRRYALEPAARFLRVEVGADDPNQLVARVKTLAQIRGMGGEVLADSVVLGETAYQVEAGFLAEASVVEAAGRAAPAGDASPAGNARALPRDLEERRKEAEALARFLLDNLS
jgi:hypothetical protein